MKTILLDEHYAEVSFDNDNNLGIIVWKSLPEDDEYKKAFEILLKYAEDEDDVEYFISDIRKQGAIGPEKRKWFIENALPRAVASGLKRSAVVSDANIFKRYYMNAIFEMAKSKFGLPLRIVQSFEEAMNFLYKENKHE